jgi:hypothetical protein
LDTSTELQHNQESQWLHDFLREQHLTQALLLGANLLLVFLLLLRLNILLLLVAVAVVEVVVLAVVQVAIELR